MTKILLCSLNRGYIYFDADHKSMLCMSLTEDYLHADVEIASSYPNMTPPFTREAPALFEAKGKKYMITSGMTGYVPNKSDSAVADGWEDVFVSMGNPHVTDDTGESRGCSRAAAPVCGFSRGTTATSVSLSWGAREVGSCVGTIFQIILWFY